MKHEVQNIYKRLDVIYERMDHNSPGVDQIFDALKNIEEAIGEMSIDPEDHALMIREREEEQYNDARMGR